MPGCDSRGEEAGRLFDILPRRPRNLGLACSEQEQRPKRGPPGGGRAADRRYGQEVLIQLLSLLEPDWVQVNATHLCQRQHFH
ncbi:renal cancer differentiation gene 1 protein isoform X5 [Tamandua tetradactyla]|uniref:renal cancer differentiation gene 1 protein isoform X5 n=1 Tax=Tamandua tetradactyla TaxID=48850 RepID=UPI004053BBBB